MYILLITTYTQVTHVEYWNLQHDRSLCINYVYEASWPLLFYIFTGQRINWYLTSRKHLIRLWQLWLWNSNPQFWVFSVKPSSHLILVSYPAALHLHENHSKVANTVRLAQMLVCMLGISPIPDVSKVFESTDNHLQDNLNTVSCEQKVCMWCSLADGAKL